MTLAIADGVMLRACIISRLTPEALRAKNRRTPLVRMRQALMLVLRERTAWSLPQIARFVGVDDHTTVIHGAKKALEMMDFDADYADVIAALRAAQTIPPMTLRQALNLAGVCVPITAPVAPQQRVKSSQRPDARPVAKKKVRPPVNPLARHRRPRTSSLLREDGTEWEEAEVPGGYPSFMINADGQTINDVIGSRRMALGSRLLADAINSARAAA